MGIRFADPKPGACSACFNSTEERYVDFDAAYDGAVVIDPDTGTPKVWADGVPSSNDDLMLCEACVREAAELIAYKPELHVRQVREIRRLEIENEHWREQARSWKNKASEALDERLGEPRAPVRRGPGRPRKVAA